MGGINISDFCKMSVRDALQFMDTLELTDMQQKIAGQIIKEIKSRLSFLSNVGLNYLTLARSASTLSGGEPAHPAGDPNRFQPDGGTVYPG